MVNSILRHYLARLLKREDLSQAESAEFLEAMLRADASDAQIAASLIALAAKGETAAELAGMASVLRARAVKVNSCHTAAKTLMPQRSRGATSRAALRPSRC